MSERNFNMRLKSTYEGDTNTIASLEVEHRVKGEWQPLDLGIASPGFDIFVYAIFACQHRFFRVNCAERKLVLKIKRFKFSKANVAETTVIYPIDFVPS